MNQRIQHLISFILPFTVIVIVPVLIVNKFSVTSTGTLLGGVIIILIGLTLMGITISLFSKFGKGTLAPWNPTKKFVIRGPYKYVRNPMIIGVLIVLTGQSVAFSSKAILSWALIFFVINNLYFIIYEEPNLEKKFGEEYREYKKNVNRWVPKFKPYDQR